VLGARPSPLLFVGSYTSDKGFGQRKASVRRIEKNLGLVLRKRKVRDDGRQLPRPMFTRILKEMCSKSSVNGLLRTHEIKTVSPVPCSPVCLKQASWQKGFIQRKSTAFYTK
jgi:hypothetical protein